MDIVIISFMVLAALALACLILIGIAAAQFIKNEAGAHVPVPGQEDAGRKAHRVSDAAVSSI